MRRILFVFCFLLTACASQPQEQVNQQQAAKTRLSLGLTYLKNGNFTQAKFNLDKALEFAPKLADVHYSLAYYYQLVAEYEQAEKSYARAIKLAPTNGDIVNSYGVYLCQRGKYSQALTHFQTALSQENYLNTAETYENMALCSKQQGDLGSAITYAQSAIKHQPGRGKSLLLLTELYVEQQDWQAARSALGQYDRVSQVSPLSLWMAVLIEQGTERYELAKGYGNMLVQLYPKHELSQQYLREFANRLQAKPAIRTAKKVTKTATETAVQAVDEQADEDEQQEVLIHQVQKGENLYRISLKYNVKMKRLIEWNNLPDASAIFVGMKLRVSAPN